MKDTKNKLLKIAAEMFARHGYEGVSTRELAQKAKVNLSAINYYFGSKQNLYQAVIDDIIAIIADGFRQPADEALADCRSSGLPPREKIKMIIFKLLDFMCQNNISDVEASLLVKEIVTPSPAYDNLYAKIFKPMHQTVSELIAAELKLMPEDQRVLLLAHTLFGQAMMFRIHREGLWRRLNIRGYTPELLNEIKEVLRQNCDAILNAAKEM